MIIKAPKQQFVKEDGGGHWYLLHEDGTIESKHDANMWDARKFNLFPSPTSIEKDVRANPMLARWLKNELTKAFINNPRMPAESDDDYAARILKLSDRKRDKAADRGTRIHKAIENNGTTDPEIHPFYDKYRIWEMEHIDETYHSEFMIADPRIGVAGTVDRVVNHGRYGLCIMDFKTQNVRDGKAAFYESFPRQLSFYAGAYALKYNHGVLPRILSLVIDANEPSAPQEKLYTPEEQAQSYKEFLCHAWLWFSSKGKQGYWPVGKWSPNFVL